MSAAEKFLPATIFSAEAAAPAERAPSLSAPAGTGPGMRCTCGEPGRPCPGLGLGSPPGSASPCPVRPSALGRAAAPAVAPGKFSAPRPAELVAGMSPGSRGWRSGLPPHLC